MQCKNCKNALSESHKYCEVCGAKVIKNRLTPKVLAEQINKEFISIDNRFLKTFVDLFKKPEIVILTYINGTRKRYLDVLQYFAISLTLVGVQVFFMTTFYPEVLDFDMNFLMSDEMKSNPKSNPFATLKLEQINNFQGLLYIATVPFSAFASWITYAILGKKEYNFTEHLVLNLYY